MLCSICFFWSVCVGNGLEIRELSGPTYVEVTDVRGYQALVFLPSNISEATNGKLPAILFLHGIGERGSDLSMLKQKGFPRNLEGDQEFPFILIMPQCPLSTEWYYSNVDNIASMRMFLDDVIGRFPIDTSRLYITGLSMGGIGSWYFAINFPSRFAALVPVAFRGDGWSPCPAKDIPTWAFHGAKDAVIPLSGAQTLVDEFKSCGGSIRFDPYPDAGHDASTWGVAYNNPDLYDWLLRKKKSTTAVAVGSSAKSIPEEIILWQNFPNPFNPTTTISFDLLHSSQVRLEISDLLGRNIVGLLNEFRAKGHYTLDFDASGLPSGTYYCRLITNNGVGISKLTLLR